MGDLPGATGPLNGADTAWPRRSPAGAIAPFLLAALFLGGGAASPPPPPSLCLEVLDVGQGDALLLTLPGGERWLVDGGGDPAGHIDVGQRLLLPALRRRGVARLARVLATHGDQDHVGGLHAVLEELEVGELWVPRRLGAGRGLRRLISEAERRGVPVRSVEGGDALSAPAPAEVTLLHPLPGWTEALGSDADENNGSLVFSMTLGGVTMLLPGDIEAPAERYLAAVGLPRAEVLKVAHHGSRTSSTEELLEAVDPLVAVTGAGRDNRFGFPHASVSARLLRRGLPLYWTGRQGALRVCTDGWSLSASAGGPGEGWRTLGSWDAEALRRWRSRATEPPRPPREKVEPPERPDRRAGSSRGTKRRRASRSGRHRRGASRSGRHRRSRRPSVPKATPAPTPPVLLDDRTWERRRRHRRKLKAPWKR